MAETADRGGNGDVEESEPTKFLRRLSSANCSSGFQLRSAMVRCYLFSMGRVTMLMLVMPACFTASITEAKAPKGTRSSARR